VSYLVCFVELAADALESAIKDYYLVFALRKNFDVLRPENLGEWYFDVSKNLAEWYFDVSRKSGSVVFVQKILAIGLFTHPENLDD
jgi:hypothetical protein